MSLIIEVCRSRYEPINVLKIILSNARVTENFLIAIMYFARSNRVLALS